MPSRTLWSLAVAAGAVFCASGAAAGGTEGSGGFYAGDLGQAVAALIIFGLLLAILGKWAWRPIVTQIRHREEAIAGAIERAEKREREAQELLGQYRDRLNRAEAEAEKIVAQSRDEAMAARDRLLESAQTEARRSAEQAKLDIETAKQEALRELYETTTDLATEMAGRIVGKSLTGEDHRRLLDESMDEIRKRASRNP